jgi:hypothetical protein
MNRNCEDSAHITCFIHFAPGYCAPVDPSNTCNVVRGFTAIRLDANATDVQLAALDAIEGVINQPVFLSQFVTMSFARVDFIGMVRNAILQPSNDENHGTVSKAAIIAAVVAFALCAIFVVGLVRKHRRNKAAAAARLKKQAEPSSKKRFLLGSQPRYYHELDEEQAVGVPGFKMLDIEPLENPSITWSDLTSESGSILSHLSNISRTTSNQLERIEEVAEEGSQTSQEWDGSDTIEHKGHTDSLPPEYLFDDLGSSPRHHVGEFDVEDGIMDPQGCRYLVDSSDSDNDDADDEGSGLFEMECSDDEEDDDTEAVKEMDLTYALESILNTSDDTVETSNETRAVLHQSARDWDEISDASVQKWMVELLKELRKAQTRKLLTFDDSYPQE